MIEVHIVDETDSGNRLVVGPPTDPAALVALTVWDSEDEVARWELGPESARMLVEEIRRRAGGKVFL